MALKLAVPLPNVVCNNNYQVLLTQSGGIFPPYLIGSAIGMKAVKATQRLGICWKSANSEGWTQLKDSSDVALFPIWFPAPSSPEVGTSHPFHTNNGMFLLNAEDFLSIELSGALFPVNSKKISILEAQWTPSSGYSLTANSVLTFSFTAAH